MLMDLDHMGIGFAAGVPAGTVLRVGWAPPLTG